MNLDKYINYRFGVNHVKNRRKDLFVDRTTIQNILRRSQVIFEFMEFIGCKGFIGQNNKTNFQTVT